MSVLWNLWRGCRKKSEGCANCYVHRDAERFGFDPNLVKKNLAFDLPVRKNRRGEYKIPPGETFYTCFTSDFLTAEADVWRPQAWDMIRERVDCAFLFLTKRIERLEVCLPPDWGSGWDNVMVCCTCENQRRADERLPIFLAAPLKWRGITCEPLLGPIDMSAYLGPQIDQVSVGGESGNLARPCDYAWVLDIRQQCISAGVPFYFRQTGAKFIKDGRLYRIRRPLQRSQAKAAAIDWEPGFNGEGKP